MNKPLSHANNRTAVAADKEFQTYLQISQNARQAALQARREAIDEFWGAVGRALRSVAALISKKVAGAAHWLPFAHGK